MGKMTKVQRAYLQSAAISPIGQTSCYGATLKILVEAGLVEHLGLGHCRITDAGRSALEEHNGK